MPTPWSQLAHHRHPSETRASAMYPPVDPTGPRDTKETCMPTTVSMYQCGVWFCVGLFLSLGWSLGNVIISRLFLFAR